MKYTGFDNFEDLMSQFSVGDTTLTDQNIVTAYYDIDGYEGVANVVFQQNGKLYEVHGSHCSCYGLEGQWEPEETSKAALLMQKGWTDEQRKLIEAVQP